MKKNRKKKSYSWIFFLITIVILLAAIAAFLYFMKVERVSVTGIRYSNRETVANLVFPDEEDYRLYRVILKELFGTGRQDAFSECTVRLTGIQSAEISIVETEAVCQMVLGESHVYLNENGVVLGNGAGTTERIIPINGFTVLSVSELEKIRVNDEKGLDDGIKIISALREQDIFVDQLIYENGTFKAEIGRVTVLLGTSENIRAKAAELSGQIRAFQNLSGILHLENYVKDGENKAFYFEVTP